MERWVKEVTEASIKRCNHQGRHRFILNRAISREDLLHFNVKKDYVITVPTTCSRPSIEMVGFIFSPCSLAWPHLWIFFSQIWYVGLLVLSNVHLGIRFLI